MFVIRYYKFFYIFSAILILASILAFWRIGLTPSIEFKGGSLMEVSYEKNPPSVGEIQNIFSSDALKNIVGIKNIKNASVQKIGEKNFLLRFREVDEAAHQEILKALPGAKEMQFHSIGPVIGEELKQKTFTGLFLAVLGMFFYVVFAFRKISGKVYSWEMSIAAIIALTHDILITAGGFIILSHYYGFEAGTLFVAAELTIWGYSINDTIVVFDRIRENLLRESKKPLREIMGISINQTLTRSLNTSLAVFLLLVALAIFGPSPLFPFVAPLLIGVIVGTYSSVCIATPLLLQRKLKTVG